MTRRALALLGWSLLAAASGHATRPWAAGDSPDQVLVLWRSGLDRVALAAAAAALGQPADSPLPKLQAALDARVGATPFRDTPLIALHQVSLAASGGAAVDAAVAAYLASGLVASAEPDAPVHLAAARPAYLDPLNASLYAQGAQWALTRTAWPAAAAAYSASQITLQAQVTVAVIDTGVDSGHPEFSGVAFLPGVNYSTDPGGSSSTDDNNGHGTFCTGLIAGVPQSGAGLYGAFFDSAYLRVLPVKALNACGGGDMGGLSSGIAYAVAQGAKVLSMSVEGTSPSDALQAAVNAADDAGALLVAAAGNNSGSVGYPAAYARVISVGALDHTDAPAWYTNTGKLDLSAPGGDDTDSACGSNAFCQGASATYPGAYNCLWEIWSLAGSYPYNACGGATPVLACGPGNGYAAGAGTSFATPLVAAAAALLFSQDPSRSARDVAQRLVQSASPTALGPGFHSATGWGKLSFWNALNSGYSPPAPGSLTLWNFPNPFRPKQQGHTTFDVQLPGTGPAGLDLVDAAGQLVKHWSLSGPGRQLLDWDGLNEAGMAVANGGYRGILRQGSLRTVAKVAVLR